MPNRGQGGNIRWIIGPIFGYIGAPGEMGLMIGHNRESSCSRNTLKLDRIMDTIKGNASELKALVIQRSGLKESANTVHYYVCLQGRRPIVIELR